jgi:hypothetical protein
MRIIFQSDGETLSLLHREALPCHQEILVQDLPDGNGGDPQQHAEDQEVPLNVQLQRGENAAYNWAGNSTNPCDT